MFCRLGVHRKVRLGERIRIHLSWVKRLNRGKVASQPPFLKFTGGGGGGGGPLGFFPFETTQLDDGPCKAEGMGGKTPGKMRW